MSQLKRKKFNSGPVYELRLPEGKTIHGLLLEHAVWVYDEAEIDFLDQYGAFGKGILSRGKPDFHERLARGEVGHELEQPFQRLRPYLKTRDQKRNRPKKAAPATSSESLPSQPAALATPTETPAAPIDTNMNSSVANDAENKKRKRDPIEEDPGANLGHEIDPEAAALKEPLQLMFEEAFFLKFVVNCLDLSRQDGTPVSTEELWQHCMSRQPNFLNSYVAYHYYRSQGWVPKPGAKMGVDWAIYHLGPRYNHAPFGILVIPIRSKDCSEILRSPESFLHFRWTKLGALFRVIHGAAKELMCTFIVHPDEGAVNTNSFECLSQFTVEELIVDRWVPKEDRDVSSNIE